MMHIRFCESTSSTEGSLLILSEDTIDLFVSPGDQFKVRAKVPVTLHCLLKAREFNSSYRLIVESLANFKDYIIQSKCAVPIFIQLYSRHTVEYIDIIIRKVSNF